MNDPRPIKAGKDQCAIANGELDGLSNGACFIFGVEWERFRTLLERNVPFQMTVHTQNRKRLVDLGRLNLREVVFVDDKSGHSVLDVMAY